MMNEASFTGFLKTLLTILVVWWVVRFLIRLYMAQRAADNARKHVQPGPPDNRAKGEVRIERVDDPRSGGRGRIEDADYEELK
jgi:flagellar biosynthesis/type III secretory pathway M-ring protein FliF/YscJ